MAKNTGEKNGNAGRPAYGEYEKEFMQLLRSQRLSLPRIARIIGCSPETVRKWTEAKYFPAGTNLNLIYVARQLAIRAELDA